MKLRSVLLSTFLAVLICALPLPSAQAQTHARAAAPATSAGGEGDGLIIPNPMIVLYKNAKANFGHAADAYLPIQVTVSNEDDARQFQISNITIDFDPSQCRAVLDLYPNFDAVRCEAQYNHYFAYPVAYSPVPQGELLGVAGVKQIQSARARAFRLLDFSITMSSALAPFNFIGRDGRAGIGILAGTGVGALERLFPDLSPGQLQRLSAQSYDGKTIVGPQQAATFVVFIPAGLVFSNETWALYKQEKGSPESLEIKRLLQLFVTVTVTGSQITSSPQTSTRSTLRLR